MNDAERRKLLNKAVVRLKQTKDGYHATGPHWAAAMGMLNELDEDLKPDVEIPLLGPIQKGGPSLLKVRLTHETTGLPLYPAIDTAWAAGTVIIAPEDGEVTRHSGGPGGGYSVYMTGKSDLDYYGTHLKAAGRHAIGAVKRGQQLGVVGSPQQFPDQRVAHVHFGVNAEKLLGKGKQLKYGEGAATIGVQLAKDL